MLKTKAMLIFHLQAVELVLLISELKLGPGDEVYRMYLRSQTIPESKKVIKYFSHIFENQKVSWLYS